jgi:hypothetical protein
MSLSGLTGLILVLSVNSLAQLPNEKPSLVASGSAIDGYEARFPALGTSDEIKVFSANAELVSQTVHAAELRTNAIEGTLTDYDPDCEESSLSERAFGGQFVTVSLR